jgi:MFS transporter, ACS family, tartrate transporter
LSSLETATLAKVTRRILPFLVLAYTFDFIDRINVAFAALAMNQDLGFTASVFGRGAGILFVALFLFGLPGNLALARFGARRWLSSIMMGWGLVSTSMMFVGGAWSFYLIRFVQGAVEAGFFPGVILYLTFWFPARRRASVVARFMFAQPVALIVAGALSGWLLGLDGVLGLKGWQWMFLAEGLPSFVLGVIATGFLTDRPKDARWLRPEEREWLQTTLDAEAASVGARQAGGFAAVLNLRVLLLCVIYLTMVSGVYGVNLWLPQILKSFGSVDAGTLGLLSTIPFIATSVGILIVGWSSDHFRERTWHVTGLMLMAGITLIGGGLVSGQLGLAVALLSLSCIGVYSAMPIFWTLPPTFLSGTAVAAGIALINAIGNLGGFCGPFVVGAVKDATGSYLASLLVLGGSVLIGGVLVYGVCRRTERSRRLEAAR